MIIEREGDEEKKRDIQGRHADFCEFQYINPDQGNMKSAPHTECSIEKEEKREHPC